MKLTHYAPDVAVRQLRGRSDEFGFMREEQIHRARLGGQAQGMREKERIIL